MMLHCITCNLADLTSFVIMDMQWPLPLQWPLMVDTWVDVITIVLTTGIRTVSLHKILAMMMDIL